MPLTLVLGPANSAKAGEVFAAFDAAAPPGALLVVPTAIDAGHYSRELAERGSILGSVLTFGALVEEIARRAGYEAGRLTQLQRERVLARVVRSAGLEALGPAAEARGFAGAAGDLLAELERSMVSPQQFAAAMRTWGSEDPRRAAYACDVGALYLAYARELERLERVDSELFAWRSLDALRQAPARWGSEPVFLYGFDDLHPLERDAVETFARIVGVEVTVSLTYEPARAALHARAELVEDLRAIAERVIELPAVDEYYEPRSRAVLHHIERSLFEPGPAEARIDPGPAVGLFEAAGTRAEAELVASEVIGLLEQGTPADQIAIVYRSLARVAPVIARTFAQYGIPVAIQQRVPFGHTALGRGVLALGRCGLMPEAQAAADDLLRYLRTPGVLDRPEVADKLELEVRRDGLVSAKQARERLGFALQEIDALRAAPDPAAELVRHGRRLLAAPHRMSAAVLDDEEEFDARALAAMLSAVAELDELGDRVSGPELIDLLEGLEVTARALPAPGAVVVSEPLAIRARRFRMVFVCGLQEDEFPRRQGADPFLGDERRRELAACSGLRLRTGEDALERERYLFYAAISRASERIVLSYRSADEEGNLQLPSPFIADVAELLVPGWHDRRRTRLLADLVWPRDAAPTARELARSLAAASAPVSGEPAAPVLALTATARAHVRHTQVLSAGALEAFANCPVKWLVERELQPAALEGEADPLLRGSYMHDTLERVLARLGRAVTPESLSDALRILEEEITELSPQLAAGRPEVLRRAVAERIAADLRRYLEWEAAKGCGWVPRWLELRFGFEGEEEGDSLPPLELGEERVAVRGAIDRVDVDPEGRHAIIRDYKSGSSRPEHQGARWRGDRQLQVALYMLAARELLGLEPVAGLYQPLGGGDLRARGVFLNGAPLGEGCVGTDGRGPDELQAELDDARERAIALGARLRAGQLVPCPATCSREGCMFPSICRVS
jgi:ATP-dependent helicase/DNAse subunit B